MLDNESWHHKAELLSAGLGSEERLAREEDLQVDEVELESQGGDVDCLKDQLFSFDAELETGLSLGSSSLGVSTAFFISGRF